MASIVYNKYTASLATIFVLGFVVLIFWLSLRLCEVQLYINNATATNFTLIQTTNTSSLNTQALYFNITINLFFDNPNRKDTGIYYDSLEASVLYDDMELQMKELESFYLHPRESNFVDVVFQGNHSVNGIVSESYEREKSGGKFSVELKVSAELRHKVWFVKRKPYNHVLHWYQTLACY